MHVALAGGVGGAKLALGLARILPPEDLLIVVNTGDDFTHLGMRICPDLDTVTYTLAGIANQETGWGIRDETWKFMERTEESGGETWFRIGDRDLETHRARTAALATGESLSSVTDNLRRSYGIRHRIVPASDDKIRTIVLSKREKIPFQEYFVRRACEPPVTGFEFAGAETAAPAPAVLDAFPTATSLVICPSNPFVSIGPILAIPAVRSILEERSFPAVAVSPVVGSKALKGPAAKMMRELGMRAGVTALARYYRGLIDGLIVDETDRAEAAAIERMGQSVLATGIVMNTDMDKARVASQTLKFANGLV